MTLTKKCFQIARSDYKESEKVLETVRKEAMLYYLFMMADGDISYNEEKNFNKICEELEIDEIEKQSIAESCLKLVQGSKTVLDVIKDRELEKQLGQVGSSIFNYKDAVSNARIIWNLVNLGYADKCYSEEEKRIVCYFIEKWDFDKEVYQEMIDTSETILALTNQKTWAITTLNESEAIEKKKKSIEDEIGKLFSDIQVTIEECRY